MQELGVPVRVEVDQDISLPGGAADIDSNFAMGKQHARPVPISDHATPSAS